LFISIIKQLNTHREKICDISDTSRIIDYLLNRQRDTLFTVLDSFSDDEFNTYLSNTPLKNGFELDSENLLVYLYLNDDRSSFTTRKIITDNIPKIIKAALEIEHPQREEMLQRIFDQVIKTNLPLDHKYVEKLIETIPDYCKSKTKLKKPPSSLSKQQREKQAYKLQLRSHSSVNKPQQSTGQSKNRFNLT